MSESELPESVGLLSFLSRSDPKGPESICLAACSANVEQLLAIQDSRPCSGVALHSLQSSFIQIPGPHCSLRAAFRDGEGAPLLSLAHFSKRRK